MNAVHALIAWGQANPVLATLILTAAVNTMPPALPGWKQIHAWSYGWLHDAAKLFMNYRSGAGAVPPASNQKLPN